MKSFLHIFSTWVLAHAFHVIIFSATDYCSSTYFDPGIIGLVLLVGPILSIPSLFISWLLFQLLYVFDLSIYIKMGLWLFVIALSLVLNFLLFLPNAYFTLITEVFPLIIPALIASFIAIIIRRPQFQNLLNYKINEHETYLV